MTNIYRKKKPIRANKVIPVLRKIVMRKSISHTKTLDMSHDHINVTENIHDRSFVSKYQGTNTSVMSKRPPEEFKFKFKKYARGVTNISLDSGTAYSPSPKKFR